MAFPDTRWTLIQKAAAEPSPESQAALESLCHQYVVPVFAFVRRRVDRHENAEDVTQEFFARLLSGNLLQRADADRGRFRSVLLKALRDFLADVHDFEMAHKRGGHVRHVSLSDAVALEPMQQLSPDAEFDRRWATAVLERAMEQLEAEYRSKGRGAMFDSLRDQLDSGDVTAGRDLAAELRMSEAAVRVAVHRMRKRLGILIRNEIAATVPSTTEVDDELIRLQQALAR